MSKQNLSFFICSLMSLLACRDEVNTTTSPISSLRFIGEKVIPHNMMFDSSRVGGLSSIDYQDGSWYLISDDKANIRFYTASIQYDKNGIQEFNFRSKQLLLNTDNQAFEPSKVDPEAMRFDPDLGQLVWTSEGYTTQGIDPFIRIATTSGQFVKELPLPSMFNSNAPTSGPRLNGSFEGLSLDVKQTGYWVSMEEPLLQDGAKASFFSEKRPPIRITHINKQTGKMDKQYVYLLDKVLREPIPKTGFSVNGLVEVLAVTEDVLLVMERSYSVGYPDGGNDVRIYQIQLNQATDVQSMDTLKGATYTPVSKKLLLDLAQIRAQLNDSRLDNLEGITFGPALENGHLSLALISDNNFNPIQVSQLLIFEVIP